MSKTVTCVDIHGKTRKFPVEELNWRPSTYGIVIKGDKILLSRQFGDRFDLPGGGVDMDENLEDGVVREVKEETGMDVKQPKLLGVEDSYFWSSHANGTAYHSLMFYYSCEFVGGEFSTEGFDEWEKEYAEMAEWFPLDNLDEIKVASSIDYRRYVKKALKLKK